MPTAKQRNHIFYSAVAAIEASARAAGTHVPRFPDVPRGTVQALRSLPIILLDEVEGEVRSEAEAYGAPVAGLLCRGLAKRVSLGWQDRFDTVEITPAGESVLAEWDAASEWEGGTSFAAADVVKAFEAEQDRERVEARKGQASVGQPLAGATWISPRNWHMLRRRRLPLWFASIWTTCS